MTKREGNFWVRRRKRQRTPFKRWHTKTFRKKTVKNVMIIALVILLIGGVYHHRAFIIPTFLKFIGYAAPGIGRIISPPNITDIERAIFIYTNIERKKHGIKELIWDEKLSEIARTHSRDMAQNNFFSHINLNGEDPTARAKKYGYPIFKDLGNGLVRVGIAENIGKMTTGYISGIGWVYNDADSIAKAQVEV
ncbi:MAG: CAP domain-containing protein, partial [Candidatus Bathyarchaeia archaeon]